jgi:hypothetical protein
MSLTLVEKRVGRWTFGLLVGALAAMWIGRFITLDDRSGPAYEDDILGFAYLAALMAIAGVCVAWSVPRVRRRAGWFLLAVAITLFTASRILPGFRFGWGGDEGELFEFEVLLLLVGLTMARPPLRPPLPGETRRRSSFWRRLPVYLAVTLALMVVAFFAGVTYYDNNECSTADYGGECDLGGLWGLILSAATLLLSILTALVTEIVVGIRGLRRRRARRGTVGDQN